MSTTSASVCTSCTRGVQENGSICLVVLQTVEILGLILCGLLGLGYYLIVAHRKCIAKHD